MTMSQSSSAIGWVVVWLITAPSAGVMAKDFDLTPAPKTGKFQHVTAVVEVKGDLLLNADGSQVRRVPMDAKGKLQYVEKFLPPGISGRGIRALRSYAVAEAGIRIQDSELRQTLRDERRLIVADVQETATLFSPSGPLTRDELDLIDVPASSTCLDLMLPGKTISQGGKWSLLDGAVVKLLGLEAVGQQDVTATVVKVEDGLAIIDLAGKVSGAVGGVSTEIELQGKANFHLDRKTVSWLALQYQEKRSVGHAQPGYDATIRVRVQVEPSSPDDELSDAKIARLKLDADHGQTLVEFEAEKAAVKLFHDRRWRIMVDRFDTVIMRLVDRGDLIAQCNLTRVPSLPKGEQLSLAAFQRDVEQTLGKNLGKIVDAAQSRTDLGLRVLRVTVSGTASELPIQWTYYHVTDGQGNRATLVFTMESKLVDRFAHVDHELLESLTLSRSLIDDKQDSKPAAAESKEARRSPSTSQAK